mgnify:CR=1 FL=1
MQSVFAMALLVLAPYIKQGLNRDGVVLPVERINRLDTKRRNPILLHGRCLIGHIRGHLDAKHVIVPGAFPLLFERRIRGIGPLAEGRTGKERRSDKKREGGAQD